MLTRYYLAAQFEAKDVFVPLPPTLNDHPLAVDLPKEGRFVVKYDTGYHLVIIETGIQVVLPINLPSSFYNNGEKKLIWTAAKIPWSQFAVVEQSVMEYYNEHQKESIVFFMYYEPTGEWLIYVPPQDAGKGHVHFEDGNDPNMRIFDQAGWVNFGDMHCHGPYLPDFSEEDLADHLKRPDGIHVVVGHDEHGAKKYNIAYSAGTVLFPLSLKDIIAPDPNVQAIKSSVRPITTLPTDKVLSIADINRLRQEQKLWFKTNFPETPFPIEPTKLPPSPPVVPLKTQEKVEYRCEKKPVFSISNLFHNYGKRKGINYDEKTYKK